MAKITDHHGNMYFETARYRGMVSASNGYAECFHTKDPTANIWTVGQEYVIQTTGPTGGIVTGSFGSMNNYETLDPAGATVTVDHTCSGPPIQ